MKTLSKILLILLIPVSFFVTSSSFAGETITVTVTEDIPGANCTENVKKLPEGQEGPPAPTGTYDCQIEKGFGSVAQMMGNIIKYFTYIASIGAVLFIVINGILYSMSGMDQSMKDEAKKRITKTLLGLIVLLLSGVILNIIAPWIYK